MKDMCEKMVEDVMHLGATECETCIEDTTETIITVERGIIHGKKKKRLMSFGLRTFLNERKGFVSGTLPLKSLDDIYRSAFYITRKAVPDTDWKHLPYPKKAASVTGIYDKELAHLPLETLKEDVSTMITSADEPDITIDSGRVSCVLRTFSISNNYGVSHEYKSTRLTIHLVVRCGASESTWGVHNSRSYDCDFAALARDTVKRARAVSNPRMLNSSFTGDAVFLAEPVEDSILASLLWCINAGAVERTQFARSFNEKVASDVITVVDDGTIHKGINSAPVDGEGNPTQKTNVITEGVLSGLLHSEYTANIKGTGSTGNGVRRAATEPAVGITNLVLKGGSAPLDELVGEVKKGVLVGDFSGNVDPFTGLFTGVLEHSFYIEKGEIVYPVTGVMIRGTMSDLLNNICILGQDQRTGETGMYAVPALIEALDIIVM